MFTCESFRFALFSRCKVLTDHNNHTAEMADEAPFQFLHQELIQYIYKSKEQGEVRNESDFFDLELSDITIITDH